MISIVFPGQGSQKVGMGSDLYNQFDYVDLISKFELLENLDTIKKIGIENKEYIKNYLNKNLLIKEFEKILYE